MTYSCLDVKNKQKGSKKWVLQPQPPWQGEAGRTFRGVGDLMPGVGAAGMLEMSPSKAIPVTFSCPMQLTRLESSAC